MAPRLTVFETPGELARGAAGEFLRAGNEAIAARGRFLAALSGGGTPRTTHEAIVARAGEIEWSRVHFFWGDERCVAPDDPRSNFRMARETLLSRVPVPPENAHRWKAELSPGEAAGLYERDLVSLTGSPPTLDFLFLGLGADGHTASLFPGTEALAITNRPCAANFVPSLQEWRLTLTFPVVDAAREVLFLVEGEEKRAIVRKVEEGGDYPAARVRAAKTLWFLDRAAAGE
jgi:6-phosphogluconolactonase